MDGRGDLAELPVGYPPANRLWMERQGIVPLTEPLSTQWARAGFLGLFGWRRLERTSADVVVINCGAGGSRTDQWLPGTGNYINTEARIKRAQTYAGVRVAGYVVFMGLNDAAAGVSGATFVANLRQTLTQLLASCGEAPIYVIRYPKDRPIDVQYPTHVEIREAILQMPATIVDAPEGPWYELTKVHLATAGNLALATQLALVTD